jgi:GNAT superfamily N-acetyltransferase
MQDVRIYEMEQCSEAVVAAVNRLLAQLGGTYEPLSLTDLQQLTASNDTHLFLMEADGDIVAMATLAFYASPTGRKAWIEDVVVDESCRNQGFGRQIVQHAIDVAKLCPGCKLMLTSRPSRLAANHMYAALGFERRETNVYQMRL